MYQFFGFLIISSFHCMDAGISKPLLARSGWQS